MTSHTFGDVMKPKKGALWTCSGRFRHEGGTCHGGRGRGRGRGRDWQGGRRGAAATAARHLFVRIPNNRSQGSREKGAGVAGEGGGLKGRSDKTREI